MTELSNEDTERFLHDIMRQIAPTKGSEPEGQEAIRIAMAGVYAALINLERSRGLSQPQQPSPHE